VPVAGHEGVDLVPPAGCRNAIYNPPDSEHQGCSFFSLRCVSLTPRRQEARPHSMPVSPVHAYLA
jgi:hypothetical protein